MNKQYKIAIIGLGYVGLPLAVAFAEKYKVVGFDINLQRIGELKKFNDRTLEISSEQLKNVIVTDENYINDNYSTGLYTTMNVADLADCNFYIVTVPTPTDKFNRPVLTPLIKASESVGSVLKKGDIVVYESTVYPGVTEDECVPVLEKVSGLNFNIDFFAGYSPERINPGDKEHTVTKIIKVTSGSTPEIATEIDAVYSSVITAGTHKAPSIKVAEAAKVIENSQRDINIAFVNELAKIFNLMGIDTHDVLEAAGTKWNFLKFKPGLVGGHCIGVDPYYLAQKAQELGYHPEIILAGRRLNDEMGKYVATEVIKLMLKKDIKVKNSNKTAGWLGMPPSCLGVSR
jgi:UDP-N-acetyl-D-galactosamine dehydrogenase